MSIAIILSRVLGMFREQYSLVLFGAGWDLDAYISASRIPNALRNLLGEGAFSAVFISIFSTLFFKNKEQGFEFARKAISYLLVFSLIITAIGIATAPYYLHLIHKSAVNFSTVVELTYYIMPFLTFISLAAIFMGILNSWQVYFTPGIAPFFGNVAFLIALYFLHPVYGIISLGLAFFISSVIDAVIQIPSLLKRGFKFRFNFKIDEHLKFFFKSLMPVAFGMAVFQLNRVISTVFSSPIEGGNTLVERAFIIAQLVLSVFITGISAVTLPLIAREERDKLNRIYIDSIRWIFIIVFPCAVFFLLLGEEISSFIYKDLLVFLGIPTGKIDEQTIHGIGRMIFYFGPGLVFFGLVTIVTRGFQGIKLFYYPVIGCAVSVASNYVLMTILTPKIGVESIPLSISISAALNFIVMFVLFHYKTKISHQGLWLTISRSVIAGFVLFLTVLLLKKVNLPLIVKTPLILGFGGTAYLLGLYVLGEKDVRKLSGALLAKIRRKPKK